MKWKTGSCIVVLFVVLLSHPVSAEDKKADNIPWEKFSLHLGAFISDISSDLRFGSKVGIVVNAEELLDIESNTTVFRADGLWRFTKNRRHRLDFSWYSLRRNGNNQIAQDFSIEDEDGNKVIIKAGTIVDSVFNLDIYKLNYSYSFFQDDRFDLAFSLGAYIMPIEFGLTTSGAVNEKVDESITAPLPVVGLRGDFALTPRWFLRLGTELFYLQIDQFRGAIYSGKTAVEYKPWKHVGIGLGFETFKIHIEADGEDWIGIDFKGEIDFTYIGLQLYTKIFF